MAQRYRRFAQILVALGVVLLGVDVAVSYVLRRTGEESQVSRVVDEQQRTDAMYLSLLHDNEFEYKVELIEQRAPEIIALGSSRVLTLRAEFFEASFSNAGRAVTEINRAQAFLRAVDPDRLPAVILFGLDFWWFHAVRGRGGTWEPDPVQDDEGIVGLDKIRRLHDHWTQGRVPVGDVFRKVVFGEEPLQNRRFGFRSLGLSAMAGFHGFRRDGSHFYGGLLVGRTDSSDRKFRDTLALIEQGRLGRFDYGDVVSDAAWETLIAFIEAADERGVHVVLFMPPVAPAVAEKMREQAPRYLYLETLRNRLAALDGYHDYHDPTGLESTDCEFIDGFHGGDVVFQRILIDMAAKDPLLGRFVDRERLGESIRLHAGRALVPYHAVETSPEFQEVDFLGLGCAKGTSGNGGVTG